MSLAKDDEPGWGRAMDPGVQSLTGAVDEFQSGRESRFETFALSKIREVLGASESGSGGDPR